MEIIKDLDDVLGYLRHRWNFCEEGLHQLTNLDSDKKHIRSMTAEIYTIRSIIEKIEEDREWTKSQEKEFTEQMEFRQARSKDLKLKADGLLLFVVVFSLVGSIFGTTVLFVTETIGPVATTTISVALAVFYGMIGKIMWGSK